MATTKESFLPFDAILRELRLAWESSPRQGWLAFVVIVLLSLVALSTNLLPLLALLLK
jgi:hypothetical protein